MTEENKKSGDKPDFRIVQPERKEDGTTDFVSVGAAWKNTTKSGNTMYSVKIGNLRLLMFPNEKKGE